MHLTILSVLSKPGTMRYFNALLFNAEMMIGTRDQQLAVSDRFSVFGRLNQQARDSREALRQKIL